MAEQMHHYFATTALGWAVGLTLAEAMAKCARMSGLPPKLKKGEQPMYCCTYRVELPITARYSINFYMPENVELGDRREFEMFNNLGHSLPLKGKGEGS